MEEKIIKQLNWIYYGQMVLALLALTVMYYAFSKGLYEPLDRMTSFCQAVQYIIIFDALITIPLGLYLIKGFKPKTLQRYFKLAALRILLVSNTMFFGIIAYYWMGCYQSMLWVAAISAIGWYFSKPTMGKLEQEMEQSNNDQPTY